MCEEIDLPFLASPRRGEVDRSLLRAGEEGPPFRLTLRRPETVVVQCAGARTRGWSPLTRIDPLRDAIRPLPAGERRRLRVAGLLHTFFREGVVRTARAFALAAAAASVATAGSVASAQPAGEAVADLGQLGLAYPPDGWRADATAEGVALTCLAENCAGLVVDVRVVTDEPFCDEVTAGRAAEAAFPGATSIGANMHVVGDLALFFASASRGYDIESRSVAFACVNREGVRTEFTMRTTPGEPFPAFGAGTMFALLSGLSAPPSTTREFRLGDLVIPYPADRWTEPEYVPETPTLACLPPTCDWGAELAMEAQPIAPGEVCEAHAAGYSGREPAPVTRIVNPAGISFEVSRIDSMCRAMSPSQYVACGIHGNIRYTLATDGGAGCYFGPVVSEAALLDLLATIRPVTTP